MSNWTEGLGLDHKEREEEAAAERNPDVTLSTGRVVKHTPEPNGSWLATPTPGDYWMTDAEWREYVVLLKGGA
jgi:hypothetical protein